MNEFTVRPLGGTEAIINSFQRHGDYTAVYALRLKTNKAIGPVTLTNALKCLQNNYPALRLRIVGDKSRDYFKYRTSADIDLKCIIGDWVEQCDALAREVFNIEQGPLWRCRLITTSDEVSGGVIFYNHLLFSIHHAICDGVSNATYCNRLLELIDAILDGGSIDSRVLCDISPTLEECIPMRDCTWSEMMPYLKRKMIPAHSSTVSDGDSDNSKPISLMIPLDVLDENFVSNLLLRCKREGVSVNGAISAALNQAVFDEISLRTGETSTTIEGVADHAVNLRRMMNDDLSDAVGLLYCSLSCRFKVSKYVTVDDFWTNARESNANLRAIVHIDEVVKSRLLRQAFDVDKHIAKMTKQPYYTNDYSLSNMGNISPWFADGYKNITIDHICRGAYCPLFGNPYQVMVCTLHGKMYISVLWTTTLVSKEEAKRFGENVLRYLRFCIQEE